MVKRASRSSKWSISVTRVGDSIVDSTKNSAIHFEIVSVQNVEVDDAWPWKFLWSNEVHFYLDGAVNTQNCRIWGTSPSSILYQQPLHSDYVTAWSGFYC
ncbi:hypothetical protein TNCV_1526371 [Trichonephila clavipes]|nr:hypothetical protein TNCV_1526371 [Trichonephila clavipes]